MIRALAACAALTATAALALDPSLPPNAQPVSIRTSALDSYALPVGVFDGAAVPSQRFEGTVERRTWRISGGAGTSLQVLKPLREQARANGYEVVFECKDRECGGFDFRFAVEVVPAPDMYVDLRSYRFLSAVRGEAEALSLLVSVSRTATYVQVITVTAPNSDEATPPNRP